MQVVSRVLTGRMLSAILASISNKNQQVSPKFGNTMPDHPYLPEPRGEHT
jgi:hypothetical protein